MVPDPGGAPGGSSPGRAGAAGQGPLHAHLADGERVTTERVAAAAGIASSRTCRAPSAACRRVRLHASQHSDLGCSADGVLVVGCGQSALESAALLHERGAEVDIVAGPGRAVAEPASPAARARSAVSTCCTPHPRLGRRCSVSAGPGAGFGAPDAVPQPARRRSALHPSGGRGWLKPRIDGKVTIRPLFRDRGSRPATASRSPSMTAAGTSSITCCSARGTASTWHATRS